MPPGCVESRRCVICFVFLLFPHHIHVGPSTAATYTEGAETNPVQHKLFEQQQEHQAHICGHVIV